MAWRAAGRRSMAFVLLNRYLDIADAVDEAGESGTGGGVMEATDFVGTDVPGDVALPGHHYCDEHTREEVRLAAWVVWAVGGCKAV